MAETQNAHISDLVFDDKNANKGTERGGAMLNYMISGHWPWQNAKGHEFDLQVGHDSDGKPIYVPFNNLAPAELF